MNIRPRRLRGNEILRKAVRETRISADALILPLFVREGSGVSEEIPTLSGHTRYSPDTVCKGVETALGDGVKSFLLFGIPEKKDDGTGAFAQDGAVQQAVGQLKRNFGDDVYIITDVCLCGYTDHGHCGVVKGGLVDNDDSLAVLKKVALSHAVCGADMVAPSDMMDGRVAAIRDYLDVHGFVNTPIMSYAAKYSSAFYGPFRDAAGSAPRFSDRKSYQMDCHNVKEAVKEVLADVSQGADIVMVKPALAYLDVISAVSGAVNLPVAAYSVSGEYAMLKAAAEKGLIDEYSAMCESAVGVFRAGADILITYYARELAKAVIGGDIG